jgi:hypothetical protein
LAARSYDQNDLLELSPPELQRSLLKVPDELIVQALVPARAETRRRILDNLSKRRRTDVRRRAARLEESGELSDRSAAAALRNLVRQILEIAGPEPEGRTAGPAVGRAPRARRAADRPEPDQAESAPDLSPGAFDRLREARGVVSTFAALGGYPAHLRRCREGMGGAVLVKSWLGRKPRVSRQAILKAICSPPRPAR